MNTSNVNLTTLQLRDEDIYDQRQSLLAAEASRSYQSASEKRNDHNNNYIGHWPREARKGHLHAVITTREDSVEQENQSRRHRDVCQLLLFLRIPADLSSPVMVAGVTDGSRIWTNIIQKTIIKAFLGLICASDTRMFPWVMAVPVEWKLTVLSRRPAIGIAQDYGVPPRNSLVSPLSSMPDVGSDGETVSGKHATLIAVTTGCCRGSRGMAPKTVSLSFRFELALTVARGCIPTQDCDTFLLDLS